MVDARVHQVDHGEVGLVAQRDEARDPEAPLGEQGRQVEDHVAALAEHRHLTGGSTAWLSCRSGAGVGDAEAVRADQHRTAGAGDRHRLGLGARPLGAELGEPGGDRHDRASPGGDRLAHGGHERGRRDAQHDEVEGCTEPARACASEGYVGPAQHRRPAPCSPARRATPTRLERPSAEDVTPLGRVAAGAHDRDRTGLEEGGQSGGGRALW